VTSKYDDGGRGVRRSLTLKQPRVSMLDLHKHTQPHSWPLARGWYDLGLALGCAVRISISPREPLESYRKELGWPVMQVRIQGKYLVW
jgi:hypothetical protein